MFCAPTALETYAQVFEEEGFLERFEAFASFNGPKFYNLPVNRETITLAKKPYHVPEVTKTADGSPVVNFRAGEVLPWSVVLRPFNRKVSLYMSTVIFIPARFQSSRYPGKPLGFGQWGVDA